MTHRIVCYMHNSVPESDCNRYNAIVQKMHINEHCSIQVFFQQCKYMHVYSQWDWSRLEYVAGEPYQHRAVCGGLQVRQPAGQQSAVAALRVVLQGRAVGLRVLHDQARGLMEG